MAPDMALIQLCMSSGLSACQRHGFSTRFRFKKEQQQCVAAPASYLDVEGSEAGDHLEQVVPQHELTARHVGGWNKVNSVCE